VAEKPREVSLTGWLDPALEYFARQAGIPVDQYSSQVGGEGIGTALEVIADIFTKGWLNKIIQFTAGAIASGYAIWGKDVPVRLRRELLAIGTHELLRIVDPKPSDIKELMDTVKAAKEALERGDWQSFLASGLRAPEEVKEAVGLAAGSSTLSGPSASTAPASAPEQPASEQSAPQGKFKVVRE